MTAASFFQLCSMDSQVSIMNADLSDLFRVHRSNTSTGPRSVGSARLILGDAALREETVKPVNSQTELITDITHHGEIAVF